MTDEPFDDAFTAALSDRLHAAAQPVTGAGVSRSAIDGAAETGPARPRRRVALAAAAVVVLAGGAAVAVGGGRADHDPQVRTQATGGPGVGCEGANPRTVREVFGPTDPARVKSVLGHFDIADEVVEEAVDDQFPASLDGRPVVSLTPAALGLLDLVDHLDATDLRELASGRDPLSREERATVQRWLDDVGIEPPGGMTEVGSAVDPADRVGPIDHAAALTLLLAVTPAADFSFTEGQALFLQGSARSKLPATTLAFVEALESVTSDQLAQLHVEAGTDRTPEQLARLRADGGAVLTPVQRQALSAYVATLPAATSGSTSTTATSMYTPEQVAASVAYEESLRGDEPTCPPTTAPVTDPTAAGGAAAAPTTTAGPSTSSPPPSTSNTTAPAATSTTARPLADGKVVASIAIPAIDLTASVHQGAGGLDQGPGHDPESALPGRPGNVVLYGQRTAGGADFVDLDRLAVGDAVVLTSTSGRSTYRVDAAPTTVDPYPSAAERFGPLLEGPARLTLVTLTPKGSADRRLVVTATLLDHQP